MKTKLLAPVLGAIILGAGAPALAQDEAPARDWTGPYVGGSVGMSWQPGFDREKNESLVFDTNGDGTFTDTVRTTAGANAFSPGFCAGRALGSTPSTCASEKGRQIAWSGYAGYDLQFGSIVLGGVLEGGRSLVSNSASGFSTTPAGYVFSRRIDWDANARLRAGVALPTNTLIYGTGGLAFAKIKNSFATTNSFNSFTERDTQSDEWGWTAGGGIEQKITDNFSIGLIYRYTRFKTDGHTVRVGQGTPPSTTNPFVITPAGYTDIRRSSDVFDHNTVRVNASFRF